MPHKIDNFHDAWWFIANHPMYKYKTKYDEELGAEEPLGDGYWLDVYVTKVNPLTKEVDDDKSKNTRTRIWLETGPWMLPSNEIENEVMPEGCAGHDIELDCGGNTYEEAIMILAGLIMSKYGDYDDPS